MHHLFLLIFTTFQVVLARTDLTGCTSTSISSPAGASIAWYVPETGEVCDFLDCGGGRAPPKTTFPGCPLYSGTASYSPLYLAAGGGEMGVVFSSFSASFATSSATASATMVEVEGEATVEMTSSTTTTSSYSSGVTLYSSPSPSPPSPTTTATSAPTTSIPSSPPPPPPIILGSTTNTTTTTSIAEHGSRNGTTTTSTTPSITSSGILPLSQQQQQTSGATRKVVEIGRRGYWIGGLGGVLCVVGLGVVGAGF